jgi:hypothetical protein
VKDVKASRAASIKALSVRMHDFTSLEMNGEIVIFWTYLTFSPGDDSPGKFPFTLPSMTTLVIGLIKTDIMSFVECPECSQPAGSCCTSHKGKKQGTPHKSSAEHYAKEFPERVALYRQDDSDRFGKILLYNQKLAKKRWECWRPSNSI